MLFSLSFQIFIKPPLIICFFEPVKLSRISTTLILLFSTKNLVFPNVKLAVKNFDSL